MLGDCHAAEIYDQERNKGRLILRTIAIALQLYLKGLKVFMVVAMIVFLGTRIKDPLSVESLSWLALRSLLAIAGMTSAVFLIYALKIKFKFHDDWIGLRPREIAHRVFWVFFNGPRPKAPKD